MTDRELISEIKTRFRFSARDIRGGLADYELELVYEIFPRESEERINDILNKYSSGELKVTKVNNSIKTRKIKSYQRGISQGTLVI